MYLCRVAYHNLAKLSISSRLLRNVYRDGSIRQLSFGGHSGSSGENMIYALIVGGVIGGGSLYTYKVLHNDKARYNDRVAEIMERPKNESTPKELQPKVTEKADEVQPLEVVEAGEEGPAENVEPLESPSTVEPNLEKSTVEEEVIEVLPLPTSDDSQTSEEVEADAETLESTAVEEEVPAANIVEQVENLPMVAEPNMMPEEDEAETPAEQAQ
ncbi:protein MGARP isoform X1 [Leucoraja erinacea]|uniref:protein MGARP isoform X1 n=1 Tax=Leucoraja erinaceus TaxID=7782 RepID=UPI0024571205|nr:protein MGARP isoform X1 [Leucoraja erinacea]